MKKKLWGLVLLLSLLLLGTASFEARAEEVKWFDEEIVYVNPLYADVISEDELKVTAPVYYSAGETEYHETVAEAAAVVRDRMEERAATIVVGIKRSDSSSQVFYDVFEAALAHTGEPTEGDYLAFTYGGWSGNGSYYDEGGYCYLTLTFQMQYYTTAEQEIEMNTAVAGLLAQLNLDAADDYTKVCGIYDYMCDNIVYDYANLKDDSYKLKYTAYAALVNGTSVCQGYANLFYRLALELGVDARIIAGDAGGPHSWNIVKLGDVYYNLDATWDAGRSEYDYFLQNPEGFWDHTREPQFETAQFHAAYPMSEVDYSDRPAQEPVVAVYQGDVLVGKCASMEDAFALITDENGEYFFDLIGAETEGYYYMPAGEWPHAKQITFSCKQYGVVSIILTGDAYLNSDVSFTNMTIDCELDDYYAGDLPVLYARNNTLYFLGESGFLGGCALETEEGAIHTGIILEGTEATLVAECTEQFSVYETDINIGTVCMNVCDFTIYGGIFQCKEFYVSEQEEGTIMLSLSSYYSSMLDRFFCPTIDFNVENMIVAPRVFWINIDSPNEENSYWIGNLQHTALEEGGITIQNKTVTGWSIPSSLTIEKFDDVRIWYSLTSVEMYDYTEETLVELCNEASEEGNSNKWNFYYDFLWYMKETEQYPSASPENLLTYKGKLLNIGTMGLDNISISYSVKNRDYQPGTDGYTYYTADEFLAVDSNGDVSRSRDEVVVIENGVLTKAMRFAKEPYTLTIPEEATSLAEEFRLDNFVEKVVIHSGVQSIANYALAFNYADEFIVDESNPYYTVLDGVLYTKNMDKLIAYPGARGGEFVIPNTVTEIAEAVFKLPVMKKITIPSSVEIVNFGEFQWDSCEEYEIYSGTVENLAFHGNGCQRLIFGDTVNIIGSRILENAAAIEEVYLLNPTVELSEDAFANMLTTSVTIYGYAGSTAETYVNTYGEQYGLEFSALPNPTPTPTPEPTPELTPTPTPEPEGVEAFVSRLYTVILGREADETSLNTWTGYLESGELTGAEVAKGFIMSDEFLNKERTHEEFVRILYSAFFDREADPEGLAGWVDFLKQGYRKSYIFAGFANSVEFAVLCEGYGVEAGSVPITISEQQPNLSEADYNVWLFVERMYTEVLTRTPDMHGIQGWVDLLKAGTQTGAQVASGFIMSEEFLAKEMSNEEYVQIMYKAFFGREADPAGLAGWVDALETEYTKEFVFAGFANSAEFGVLCNNFGITQGSVEMPEVQVPAAASNFAWTENEDGTLTITGWLGGSVEEVIVPAKIEGKKVTVIGNNLFDENASVRKMVLPKTVTWIQEDAFSECSIEQLVLPAGLAFYEHEWVAMNDYTYTNVPYNIFFRCESLKSMEVGEGSNAYSSKDGMLYSADEKILVGIPGSTEQTEYAVPEGVTAIAYEAHKYGHGLKKLSLASTVTTVHPSAFMEAKLEQVTFGAGLESIGGYAFFATKLTSVKLPEGVWHIGNDAFCCCYDLAELSIPGTLKNIGTQTFAYCYALDNLVIPEGVESIGALSFYQCTGLTNVKLPASLTSIAENSFDGCTALEKIYAPAGSYAEQWAREQGYTVVNY